MLLKSCREKLARDPKLFAAFGKAWYSGTFKEYPSFPSKLLLAGEFSNVTAPAAALYTDFIGKLSSFLNASVSDFSVAAAWNESSGTGVPITQFVNKVRDRNRHSTHLQGRDLTITPDLPNFGRIPPMDCSGREILR